MFIITSNSSAIPPLNIQGSGSSGMITEPALHFLSLEPVNKQTLLKSKGTGREVVGE